MTSTGLQGPYLLSGRHITLTVNRTSAGAYAVGRQESGTFYVDYVGRSDDDVAGRVRHGILYSPSYAIFKLRPERQVLQMHG
jgi:hypothetical protein